VKDQSHSGRRGPTNPRQLTASDISYRGAESGDYLTIARMHAHIVASHARNAPQIFKEPTPDAFGAEEIEDYLQNRRGFVFVAAYGAKVVGYLSGRVIEKAEDARMKHRKMVYLDALYIDKMYRGNRLAIGKRLVKKARTRASKEGVSMIAFDVWAFNKSALKFCRGLGFDTHNIVMYDFLSD